MTRAPIAADRVVSVVVAGIGGQGVITASDVLAEAAFLAGYDVKKSELHGMSQRRGSVTSDVRFGREVLSPMVPPGEADVLIALFAPEIEIHRVCLREGGVLLAPDLIPLDQLPDRRTLNVALLGVLSRRLDLPLPAWHESIRRNVRRDTIALNLQAFDLGKKVSGTISPKTS